MKKFLAILAAMMLISTVAFGDELSDSTPVSGGGVEYSATEETVFDEEISLEYTSTGNVVVYETLTFTAASADTNPDGGTAKLEVAALAVSSLEPGCLSITVPSLSVAGIYEWTITENIANTAGVTYSSDTVHVTVLVEYDNTNHKLVIGDYTFYIDREEDGTKSTTLTNKFEAHGCTVAKDVQGNMSNENDEFEITVTLVSYYKPVRTNINFAGSTVTPDDWTEKTTRSGDKIWEYSKALNYSEAAGPKTFSNLPHNVYVKVEETESEMNGYEYVATNMAIGGEVSADEDGKPLDIGGYLWIWSYDQDCEFTVVNSKTSTIVTGVSADSLPYIVLLGAAVMVGAAMIIRRRAYNR